MHRRLENGRYSKKIVNFSYEYMKKYKEDSFVGLNDLPRSHFIDA